MYEQNNIVSPAGTIHANNPEEPRQQSLCIQYGSYHWTPTYEPITCKTCLRILGSRKARDMSKQTRWIVVDFDCYHGCNNPEFDPKCDESSIRIKIDEVVSEKFELFEKYMEIPCPRCGKVGAQKRSGWWDNITDDTKLSDPDPAKGSFSLSKVQDYTTQMLEAKETELARSIVTAKKNVKCLRETLKAIEIKMGRKRYA